MVGNDDGDEITGTNITDANYTDKLYGNDGDDEIRGGDGNDFIYGGLGNDDLRGGSGDDIYYFIQVPISQNLDTITDSSGTSDQLNFRMFGSRVMINMGIQARQPVVPGYLDIILTSATAIDKLYGSAYDDVLNGHDDDDYISGGDGNDSIAAGAGEDTLYGGNGEDSFVVRGGGNDTIYGLGEDDTIAIEGPLGSSVSAFGGAGDDVLTVAAGAPVQDLTLDSITLEAPADRTIGLTGDFGMSSTAQYAVGIREQAANPPNGRLNVTGGDADLAGTLSLTAIDHLDPDDSKWDAQTRTIITADNITGEFDAVPGPGVHLGYGVFVDGQGVFYDPDPNPDSVKVDLLQALPGDTNGDCVVDIANDGSALILNLGTTTAMDWPDGDFNHDQAVDIGNDGSALIENLGKTCGGEQMLPGGGELVSAGQGDGYIDQNGNIFLEMDQIALYSVYVGNDVGDQVYGTDALQLDVGATDPAWVFPLFSTTNNTVDSAVLEAFEEMMTAGDYLTAEPYDTLVNVDFSGLVGEATGIWLKYQQSGAVPQIIELLVAGGSAPASAPGGAPASLDPDTLAWLYEFYAASTQQPAPAEEDPNAAAVDLLLSLN